MANNFADFDPKDDNSWYFGMLRRDEATDILMEQRDSGVFLVRDSSTIKGDYVLCVKEDNKVSHYIVNKLQSDGVIRYRIGDQEFPDIPSLLSFYKTHYLDTTSLIRVAPRNIKVLARYKFDGKDPEDLPFAKGEVLTVLRKDEDQWWTARSSSGKEGSIPVPYVELYNEEAEQRESARRAEVENRENRDNPDYTSPGNVNGEKPRPTKLPRLARAILQRLPNAYDKSALKLEVGDVIKVTNMDLNGTWEGELNGKKGHFPFKYVEIIDEDEHE